MLLAGATNTAVSQTLNIDRKTLYRWRISDPAYRDHLAQRRREACDDAVTRLSASLTLALDVFDRQLKDPFNPTSFKAARAVLAIAQIGKLLNPDPAKPPK